MEESKSGTSKDDDGDHFLDALDDFPFYDCLDWDEPHQSTSPSSSITLLEPIEGNANVSTESNSLPEISSPTVLHSRRSFPHLNRKDISRNDSKPTHSPNASSDATATGATAPRDRKFRFSRNLKENDGESEKAGFSSGRFSHILNEENKEISIVTAENDEKVNESVTVDSRSGETEGSRSNFLFFLVGLMIKAIGFQFNLLISCFTYPIWLLYRSYMFVIDPFGVARRSREYFTGKLSRAWDVAYENAKAFMHDWLKEHKSIWMLPLRFGWGLLWSIYVCFILVGLLVFAFVIGGFMTRVLVEEPIRMVETLNFDYTENSPVALLPIIFCPDVSCTENCGEKIVGKLWRPRVIPRDHKLQATVSLTLPESDYNRNLGIFQVRIDFFSANGDVLASSRSTCMLQFRSQPIRLLLTFLKAAPLLTGYLSESQTLNIKLRGFVERDTPTACIRVTIEQRAEYRPDAGIPEIYAASLTLESELPLLRRILWYWKRTIFIWLSMTLFTMELLFALLCCKPIIIPRVRLRDGSASDKAPQNGSASDKASQNSDKAPQNDSARDKAPQNNEPVRR